MKKILCIFISLIFIVSMTIPAFPGEEVYEVYMQYTGFKTDRDGFNVVEEALNDITVPAIGVKVHLIPVFIGNLPADTAYAIAGGDKIDIVNVGLTNDISSMVSEGLLLPLDELLIKFGVDALKATEKVSAAQRINGITYAISQYPFSAHCSGFRYNKELADRLGLEIKEEMTMEELGELGEKLKDDGIYLTSVGFSHELGFKFFTDVEIFGDSASCGAILDPTDNSQVINLFDSEPFRDYCRKIRFWYEQGYMPENQFLSESEIINLYGEQQMFCLPTNIVAGQKGTGTDGMFTSELSRTSDIMITTSGVDEFMLGIASTCENPEAAMSFINLIYKDENVANLLKYGVEGINYRKVEGTENVITNDGIPEDVYISFGSGFVRFGNPLKNKILYPLTDDYYDFLIDWENSAVKSKAFGYTFDVGDYSVQAKAVSDIVDEYLPLLNTGMVEDVDGQIDEMVQLLEEAGIDEIIEANNQQLNAYLASKK